MRGIEEPTIMDQKPDEILDAKSARLAHQAIRPPDLPQPKAAPEPPQESIPKASPSPFTAGPVSVKIRSENGGDDDESPASGLAPFNTRVTAMIVDIVVAVGLIIGLNILLPEFAHKLSWLVGFAYIVTRDSLPFLGGQSVGKKAMNLRAVTLDGKPLTGNWEPGLIRSAVLMIPFFALVEIFILLTREGKPDQGRRLGDEWAKTKVIVVPVEEKSV